MRIFHLGYQSYYLNSMKGSAADHNANGSFAALWSTASPAEAVMVKGLIISTRQLMQARKLNGN
jgi:hypothetical protein